MQANPIEAHTSRVLVVDDDPELRDVMAAYLSENGFIVGVAADGSTMDQAMAADSYDVLVLDLMLPGEDGLSICRRLGQGERPAVLMLSAARSEVDRIVGLEVGADDYLSKPCNPRELLARIRALLRRRARAPAASGAERDGYRFEGFMLDLDRHRLETSGGVAVVLTPSEFALLKTFVGRPRRSLERAELLEALRGSDYEANERAVDTHVSRLRRKLHAHVDREIIVTHRGHGYMLNAVVTRT